VYVGIGLGGTRCRLGIGRSWPMLLYWLRLVEIVVLPASS